MNKPACSRPAIQLLRTAHALESRLEEGLAPLGLSVAKFGVLANLAAAGEPLPLRALAERAACVRSNITQLIDRLEADRLVLRAPDPVDRRSIRAELTEEGRARYEKGLEALQQAESAVFAHMAPRDVESLVAMLESLRNAG